jgi:hypothetical protein
MNIIKKIFIYQSKRFPVKYLFFTTSASVICSSAVINYETSILKIIAVFFAIMFFLFHVRVIDEFRDFKEDAVNHPDNPVHNGIISLKQLLMFDIIGLLYIILVSVFYGKGTIIFAGLLVVFTTIASQDFFIRKFIIKKNILYHVINSPQMVLLQLYIFSLLTGEMIFTKIMWLTAFFAWMNVFVLEVVRKIKIVEEESPVADTYSKSLGFSKALVFNLILSIVTCISYMLIIIELEIQNKIIYILLSLPIIIYLVFTTIKHLKSKTKKTEKMLLLSVMLMYVGLNIFICISVI